MDSTVRLPPHIIPNKVQADFSSVPDMKGAVLPTLTSRCATCNRRHSHSREFAGCIILFCLLAVFGLNGCSSGLMASFRIDNRLLVKVPGDEHTIVASLFGLVRHVPISDRADLRQVSRPDESREEALKRIYFNMLLLEKWQNGRLPRADHDEPLLEARASRLAATATEKH